MIQLDVCDDDGGMIGAGLVATGRIDTAILDAGRG
jgi:hypothetical protein